MGATKTNIIKETRLKKGMTQAALAEKVGATRTAVSKWENGKNPTVKMAMQLSAVLGVDWTLFFTATEPDEKAG